MQTWSAVEGVGETLKIGQEDLEQKVSRRECAGLRGNSQAAKFSLGLVGL